ncbi:MAG: lysine--tRNA ligase [Candidatus Aenigmarchaeota archaeon]|nr:lysine--tRNA ligase [Candidatus Aenigmarchaeota archaeon]
MNDYSTAEEEFRVNKVNELIGQKINPYPSHCQRTYTIQQVIDSFDQLNEQQTKLILVGRLKAIRSHGKATFADLVDGTAKLQVYLKQDNLGEKEYQFCHDFIDLGDFVEMSGKLFLTHRQEKTLVVDNFTLISKAILPLPEKWHGLQDKELRYRQRELDLISDPMVKNIFRQRGELVKTIRSFFDQRNYLEVSTPILQTIPGGATARPFITHHQALDVDLYLRIAPELYLKRLIVGGYERVYEIARCFRNEGIDRAHNPEFTQIEFYQAYANYQDLIKLTEELLTKLLLVVPNESIAKPPYPKITFRDALLKYAQIDLDKMPSKSDLIKQAKKLSINIDPKLGKGKIMDEIYKATARPKLIKPIFLINHPVELSPLAKRCSDNQNYTERFQLLINGLEVANGYSELNDPSEQEKRFKEQQSLREAGDEEAQRIDTSFIRALKYGMPPTAGEGIGIDRLVAIFTGQQSLKDVILFPTMRPISVKE